MHVHSTLILTPICYIYIQRTPHLQRKCLFFIPSETMKLCHTKYNVALTNDFCALTFGNSNSSGTRFYMIYRIGVPAVQTKLFVCQFPSSNTLFYGINWTIHKPNHIYTWFLHFSHAITPDIHTTRISSDQILICCYINKWLCILYSSFIKCIKCMTYGGKRNTNALSFLLLRIYLFEILVVDRKTWKYYF